MTTGLRTPEAIDGVLDQVMRVEKAWLKPGVSAQSRADLLVACVFTALDQLQLPRPAVSVCSGGSGLYDLNTYTLELNLDADEFKAEKGEIDLREALDTVYHETRHHEQTLRLTELNIWETHSAMITRNLQIKKENEGQMNLSLLAQTLKQTFHLPANVAVYFAQRKVAKAAFQGEALEEAKKWHKEVWGTGSNERGRVMGDVGRDVNRPTYYALYRTLFMEDDGWEAGYAAGDGYLKRSFAGKVGSLQAAERMIQEKKKEAMERAIKLRKLEQSPLGEELAQSNKFAQLKKSTARDLQTVKEQEVQINAKRTLLANKKKEVVELVEGHKENQTNYRVQAHQKRNRYHRTGYMGTAQEET